MSRTRRAANGALTSLLQFGVQIALQALLAPIVLRFAGQDALGAYAALGQMAGYLALLDLGFSIALGRWLAQAHAADDGGRRLSELLSTARAFYLAANVLFAAGALALAAFVGDLFELSPELTRDARIGLALLAAWTVLRTPIMAYPAGLVATQDLAYRNTVGAASAVVRMAASLALVAGGGGLIGLMAGNLAAEAVDAVLCRHRFLRKNPAVRPQWREGSFATMREMVSFGMQAAFVHAGFRLLVYSGNVIAGALHGAAQASVFYTTQAPALLGWVMIARIAESAAPAINELYARREIARIREAYVRLHRYNLYVAVPFAAVLIFLERPLIGLWVGPAQYGGPVLVWSLAAFAVLFTATNLNKIVIIATGEIRMLSLFAFAEGVVAVGLAFWLGTAVGLGGIMLATFVASIPASAYVQHRARSVLGVPLRVFVRDALVPPFAAAALAVPILAIGTRMLPVDRWWGLAACGIGFGLAYAGAAALFFKPEDRVAVGQFLRRILARFFHAELRGSPAVRDESKDADALRTR